MALVVETDEPDEVMKRIYADIENNRIDTWTVNAAGYFTAVPKQWYNRAWMRKSNLMKERYLCFGIIEVRRGTMTQELYAVYHCRFAEMILAHCGDLIGNIMISPCSIKGVDVIGYDCRNENIYN